MKKRIFLVPALIASAIGLGLVCMSNSSASNAASATPKLSRNALRIESIDTGTYMYHNDRGMKLERMIDTQMGVACYRREPAANYDCVKL